MMLSGVILAGGRSTRMGQEKGLTMLSGVPLIVHVSRTVSGIVDETLVSVGKGRTREYGEILGKGFIFVEDQRDNIGPLEGLARTFRAAAGKYVLVSPCDTPFLKARLCRLVISRAIGRDGAMPKIGWKYETLHGAYKREVCLTAFEHALAKGRLKPRDALQELNIAYVEEKEIREADPELESYRNLNNPEDLRWAEKKLSSGHV